MSNLHSDMTGGRSHQERPCRELSQLIDPKEKDLGGFSVRRVLPNARRRMVGPWVFFDHAGPVTFAPGNGIDVRPHPHIGLATVSYLFDGEIMHRDSLGFEQRIVPGAIDLMTAGSGIVHSERTPGDLRAKGHSLELLQLWLALPDRDQEIEPAFAHHAASDMPTVDVGGVKVRVLMGAAHGQQSPVQTYVPTLYVEYRIPAGAELLLPAASERALYVVRGAVEIGGCAIGAHKMGVLDRSDDCRVRATEESVFVLIGGDPVGERHVFWNFVSNSEDRIERAKQDWKDGNFAMVPGDDEFIPLPD